MAITCVLQSPAAAARAADEPAEISFTTTSATIEYGQYWSFPLECDFTFWITVYQAGGEAPGNTAITSSSVPSGYEPSLALNSPYVGYPGYLSAPYDVAPLGAGTYTFSVGGTGTDGTNTFTGETPTPATLTVEKAKLGIELRVLADPANPAAAIVTARFTGRFVDEYQSSFFPGSAKSPAGTWNITITDKDGAVATERSVERAAGDDVLATSFYWADADAGEQYFASATFTPEGVSAANFAVTQATDFPYTAAEANRPVPSSTATGTPDASLPEATGFGLPLWLLIVGGVLALGLAALVTVFSVRMSRRSAGSTSEVAA